MKAILTYFLLLSLSGYSQNKNHQITNYLILGLLHDYNGRSFYNSIKNQLDHFYPFEKPLVEFIDSLLTEENRKPNVLIKQEHFYIISKPLAKFVNSFYTFKTDSTYTMTDTSKDKDELVYLGRLNPLSVSDSIYLRYFIVGNYIRFGKIIDDSYSLQFVNSVSKSTYFLKLITQLGCTEITTKFIDAIPSSTIIQFKPTIELRNYLEKYEYLRKRITESYSNYKHKKMPIS